MFKVKLPDNFQQADLNPDRFKFTIIIILVILTPRYTKYLHTNSSHFTLDNLFYSNIFNFYIQNFKNLKI